MTILYAQGKSMGQTYHDEMVAKQLAAEMNRDSRLDDRLTPKVSDLQMVQRILAVASPAEKAMLSLVVDVGKDGKIYVSGKNLAEVQAKRDVILRLYDRTFAPTNGLKSYGQDPNSKGRAGDRNIAKNFTDPNGRRLV